MHPDRLDALTRSLSNSTSRRGALKLFGAGIAGGVVVASGVNKAAARQGLGGLSIPIQYTLPGSTTALPGTLVVDRFLNQGGALAVAGRILDAAGAVIANFTALVTSTQASCEILSLTLGPLTLDLLGLVITIPNPIVLTITAEPGPGNLLGNLLCGIAGLLDSGAGINALVRALNNLLRQLG